jgi:hypothetical protein
MTLDLPEGCANSVSCGEVVFVDARALLARFDERSAHYDTLLRPGTHSPG